MLLGDFFSFDDFPGYGTKENVDEKLDGELEIVFLGRTTVELMEVSQMFENNIR